MKFSNILAFLALCILVNACKMDSEKSTLTDELMKLESNLKADPSPQNVSLYLNEITRVLPQLKDDTSLFQNTLNKGIETSNEYGIPGKSISYLLAYLREFPKDPSSKDKLYSLASSMKKINKVHASDVLFTAYGQRYPEDEKSKNIATQRTQTIEDIDAYVIQMGEGIFQDPNQFGINKQNAQAFVDVCEAYALSLPDAENTPDNLYKAAEISRTLRTFPKTLSLYDWIIDKYPNYEKAPTALFLKGFIVENELKNTTLAKSLYQEFLDKHPKHDLADDVQFLVDNIGKTNEEILELIEKKKAENHK